jgi:hypothetical protein
MENCDITATAIRIQAVEKSVECSKGNPLQVELCVG